MNFFWSYQQLQQLYTSIKYGYLYNWWAATDSRNICSVGWSLPSNAQFDTLIAFIGANPGYALTEANLSYWTDIIGCTNSSGFNGRGAGNRAYTTGAFTGLRNSSAFWTTTVIYAGYGCTYGLYNSNHSLFQLYNAARLADGCSIRLIKDSTTLTNGQTGTYTGNDGKIYRTICIGTQEWLDDNLVETKYRDGSIIPVVTDNTAWSNLITGARCVYNNDESNM